ncbi:subtilisin-like serine protease QhpE [Luteithermobacter gelatinilyticus]|uniref:subtilisin-like serine protease QhpE n=1 Tax=Luteithermobacter gelatinilyticus TaxID=2582913 RepID=UPI001105DC81|nr:S8 family serine peptidase [Luteithermobacter gelatinilyticus]
MVKVGLIDSGVAPELSSRVVDSRAFMLDEAGRVEDMAVRPDRLGHGTAISRVIAFHAPDVEILSAQVFHGRAVTAPVVVAAALDWLVSRGVQVINMSFGLRHDRQVLSEACARAVAAGVVICAASPARGAAVYPAAYAGVIRTTGDARCAPHEYSYLNSAQADFGACPRGIVPSAPDTPEAAGASLGTAHMTGIIAARLKANWRREDCLEALQQTATYFGPERKAWPSVRETAQDDGTYEK